jgi:hypothetical protein
VGGRLFVFANSHHGDGRIALWCAPDAGGFSVASDPNFFVPPYVGRRLDRMRSTEVVKRWRR